MEFFFLNPWAMVAGGALVSSPIIIHLINRMRFKRIRWAAMEFLLKSQKRNRRRLIIEQLILLLLRILIVLFLGFLLARFVMGAQSSGQNTTHVVILDDSLSMTDHWTQNGDNTTSFDVARDCIRKMATESQKANSVQQMKVLLLSDLDTVIFDQRLGTTSLGELDTVLKAQKPTALHLHPIDAIRKAEEIFQDTPQNKHILHFASDFRDSDWVSGPGAKELNEEVDRLVDGGANLTMLDGGHPTRGGEGTLAQHHDNLAILDFKAESKLVAESVPVEFTITLANHSPSNKSTMLTVKENGNVKFEATRPVDIPANGTEVVKFSLVFAKMVKANDPMAIRENDPPEEKERKHMADREFHHVGAEINPEETGLQGDNMRDLVIEVRKKVPVLVIDGNLNEARGIGGDFFHLEVAFFASRSLEAERHDIADLDKINFDLYPTIYLLNVPEIKSPVAIQKLENYVKKGGCLVYFLGDKAQANFYNALHTKNNGLFPVLLGRPTEPLTDEEKIERKQKEEQPKILFPDKTNKIVGTIAAFEPVFRFLLIDRYWQAQPRFLWNVNPEEPVDEIVVQPNRKSMDDFKEQAQTLMKDAIVAQSALAQSDSAFAKYGPVLTDTYQREMRVALGTPYLYKLSVVFDALLNDPGNEKDPEKHPNMSLLWANEKMKTMRSRIETFNKTIRYGDPVIVTRKFGKGRIVASLIPLGTLSKWHDWSSGNKDVTWTFQIFMMDMQRVLTKQSDDLNHIVGEKMEFPLDAAKYKSTVKVSFQGQPDLVLQTKDKDAAGPNGMDRPPLKSRGQLTMQEDNKVLAFSFKDSKEPGLYTFDFEPQAEGVPHETRMYSFNVDAVAESDLRRAEKEKLERNKAASTVGASGKRGTIQLLTIDSDFSPFKARVPDFSSFAWIFLVILLILIGEQALAVYLSFHMKAGEAAQGAAAAPVRTAAPAAAA